MIQKWKEIWDKKTLSAEVEEMDEFSLFCALKRANGFDVAVSNEKEYYKYFYNEWIKMYSAIMEILGNVPENIYEVGCGSGVNLWMFKKRIDSIQNLKVGG